MLAIVFAALLGASAPSDTIRQAAEAARAREVCAPSVVRAIDFRRLDADYRWAVVLMGDAADREASRAVLAVDRMGREELCSSAARDFRRPLGEDEERLDRADHQLDRVVDRR